jgi:hypothetical protein
MMRATARALRPRSRPGLVLMLAAVAALAVGVPTAWATSIWSNIGQPQIILPPASEVVTSQPRDQTKMRLYQTEPVPSGAPDLTEQYNFPDGSLYMRLIVHWNDGTPVPWDVGGGNKYAGCGNQSYTENSERTITCQRYHVKSGSAEAPDTSPSNQTSSVGDSNTSMLSSLSVLTSGQIPSSAELAQVAPSFGELTDTTQTPAATVNLSSVRRAGPGSFIAARSDGLPCLAQRATLVCFTAFEPGGIATSLSDGRVQDSESAPFQVLINGIAEDGISTVSFNLRDGSSAQAAVINNAFSVTIPNHVLNDLSGYTVTRSDGTQTSYTYPSGEFSSGSMATLKLIH